MMRRLARAFLVCSVAITLAPSTASSARTPPKHTSTIGTAVDKPPALLEPGEYVWHPEASPHGPMVMVISLPQQLAYVYRNGVLIAASSVSTGKKGHETPTGVFTILQKHADHYSSIYDAAPMPYMQRLTWSGVALHAGRLPGYPASHGCVRMPYDFASRLYDESSTGITVVVSDEKKFPTTVAYPGLFSPVNVKGLTAAELERAGDYAWQPELATEGPITILVTVQDRRIRVFRNGTQIGWSLFTLADPTRRTTLQVLTLLEDEPGAASPAPGEQPSRRWMVLSDVPADAVSTERLLAGVQIPSEFLENVRSVLAPGTTLAVTQLAASGETTGQDLTVVTADEAVQR